MPDSGLAEDIVLRARTIFRVKTQGLALIGCAWHYLLEGVAFEELDIRCCFGGGCAAAARIVTL